MIVSVWLLQKDLERVCRLRVSNTISSRTLSQRLSGSLNQDFHFEPGTGAVYTTPLRTGGSYGNILSFADDGDILAGGLFGIKRGNIGQDN